MLQHVYFVSLEIQQIPNLSLFICLLLCTPGYLITDLNVCVDLCSLCGGCILLFFHEFLLLFSLF